MEILQGAGARLRTELKVGAVRTEAYIVPTDGSPQDSTFWSSATSVVVVEVDAGGMSGLGYTYAGPSMVRIIDDLLRPAIEGLDALDVPAAWTRMVRAVRQQCRNGSCAAAVSGVDAALWDLKGKLLGLPLGKLLGMSRSAVPLCGSDGFVSCASAAFGRRVEVWRTAGIDRDKIKVGPDKDVELQRMGELRALVGADAELSVDADGYYGRKDAIFLAEAFVDEGVTCFEEPVPSDDLDGLRLVRDRVPPGDRDSRGRVRARARLFRAHARRRRRRPPAGGRHALLRPERVYRGRGPV